MFITSCTITQYNLLILTQLLFKFIPLYAEDSTPRPQLTLSMTSKNPWTWATIILHTTYDLPEAMNIHPYFFIRVNADIKTYQSAIIGKKKIYREATRKYPCVRYYQGACQDMEAYEKLIQDFNCKISFLNFGQHLDEFFNRDLLECNQTVVRNSIDLFAENKDTYCLPQPVCHKTKFSLSLREYEEDDGTNFSTFAISFQDPEIEHHNTRISYDIFSLIGEIGGVLGLTLGISAFSFVGSLVESIIVFRCIFSKGKVTVSKHSR